MSYLAMAKAALSRLRALPADPQIVSRLISQPLDVFAQGGQPIEIRVPWLDVTLWFVPTKTDAEHLSLEGVSRGRIWTARELIDLLSGAGLRPDRVRAVALAKLEFAGDVVEVRQL